MNKKLRSFPQSCHSQLATLPLNFSSLLLATTVNEVAKDEIMWGNKLSPVIRVGQKAIYYEENSS